MHKKLVGQYPKSFPLAKESIDTNEHEKQSLIKSSLFLYLSTIVDEKTSLDLSVLGSALITWASNCVSETINNLHLNQYVADGLHIRRFALAEGGGNGVRMKRLKKYEDSKPANALKPILQYDETLTNFETFLCDSQKFHLQKGLSSTVSDFLTLWSDASQKAKSPLFYSKLTREKTGDCEKNESWCNAEK